MPEGTPLHGDRGAWNDIDFADEHARDINDVTLRHHLPLPGAQYTYVVSDGTDWIISVGTINVGSGGGIDIAAGKTLTVSNSLTLTGTDGKTLTLTDSLTVQGGGTTTLSSAGAYTLTIPATGTAALLGIANVFTATQTIQVATATDEALILKTTDDDPTENLLETQDSGGSPFVTVDGEHQMLLVASAATKIPLTLQGAAAHSANLFEVKDSGGNILTRIDAEGFIVYGETADIDSALYINVGGFDAADFKSQTNAAVISQATGDTTKNYRTLITNIEYDSASNSGQRYRGLNAFAYKKNTGSLTATNIPGLTAGRYSVIHNANSSTVALATAISAEIRNENGRSAITTSAVGFYLEPINAEDGTITNAYGAYFTTPVVDTGTLTNNYGLYVEDFNNAVTLNYAIYTNAGLVHFGDQVEIVGSAAADVQLTVKGAAAQTDPLQEWQKSDGTVYSSVLAGGNWYTNINSATAMVVEQSGVNDDVWVVDTANGRVGIGEGGPLYPQDMLGATDFLQLRLANVEADSTIKVGGFCTRHYTNAEEDIFGVAISVDATNSVIFYGGGSNDFNAATIHRFYTAANHTTVFGTERVRISETGITVLGGGGITATGTLQINVATATGEALILKTTDDDPTENLFEAQDSSANIFTHILAGGELIQYMQTVTKTGAYTATVDDCVIDCDASGGSFTITLPAVSGNGGLNFHVKKTDSSANTITVDGAGSETIDGATTILITTQYESVHLVCTGSEWWIL